MANTIVLVKAMNKTTWFLLFTVLAFLSASVNAHHKPGHKKGKPNCYAGGEGRLDPSQECPLVTEKRSPLSFPSVVAGFSQVVKVYPSDSGAAVFHIQAEPCSRIRVEVVEDKGVLTSESTSPSDSIDVSGFEFGGAVDREGVGYPDCSTGELPNVRVGGTAYVSANNEGATYQGFLTLRIWYY